MPIAREQLIDDWQRRLDGATDAESGSSERSPWLARLRVRLYRFLLSLYGDGNWNAPPLPADDVSTTFNSKVIDPAPLPLGGKPAKDYVAIRKALKCVAGARENRPQAGPLAAGFCRDTWMVIASARQGIDPRLCAESLKAKGIVPRVVGQYNTVTVEVQAQHYAAAMNLVAQRRDDLSAPIRIVTRAPSTPVERAAAADRLRRQLPWWNAGVWAVIAMWLTFPVAWLLMAISLLRELPIDSTAPRPDFPTPEQCLPVWAGLYLVALELILLRLLRERRAVSKRRSEVR